jgi:hypothetical protein
MAARRALEEQPEPPNILALTAALVRYPQKQMYLRVISVLIEIAVAYLSHTRPHLHRVPYLNVECFVQLDQQMRKLPILRVLTKIRPHCRRRT